MERLEPKLIIKAIKAPTKANTKVFALLNNLSFTSIYITFITFNRKYVELCDKKPGMLIKHANNGHLVYNQMFLATIISFEFNLQVHLMSKTVLYMLTTPPYLWSVHLPST